MTAEKQEKHVNLLLIENYYIEDEDEDEEEDDDEIAEYKFHYVWIKNLSRLVRKQISSHKTKSWICDRCLHFFWSQEKLEAHEIDCRDVNKCKITLPRNNNIDNILKFKNTTYKNRVPFVVYADFECLLEPVESDRAYEHHKAFSIGYFIKCSYDDTKSEYKSYRQSEEEDEKPAQWFVKNLHMLVLEVQKLYDNPCKMTFTPQENIEYATASHCHICSKPFTEQDNKVRDHCHLTGK